MKKHTLPYIAYIWFFLVTILSSFSSFGQCPVVTNPTPIICDADGLRVSDLAIYAIDIGNGIRWYNAPTGGMMFPQNQLIQEITYYADDISGTCGVRMPVTVDFVVDPSGQNLDGIFCSNDNATVQSYIDEVLQPNIPTGGTIEVYLDQALTIAANPATILSGNDNYYVVFVDTNGCRSQIEQGSTAVFDSPEDPTPPSPQLFCSDATPTVADLNPGTTSSFIWYDDIDFAGNPVDPPLTTDTLLIDGETYYVVANNFICISNPIPVLVIFNDPVDPGVSSTLDYCEDAVPQAPFDLFDIINSNGTASTNGTWTGPVPTANGFMGTVSIATLTPNTYVFTYTVPGEPGCPDGSATVTITIYEILSSGIESPANPATFCEMDAPTAFDLFTLIDNEDPGGLWTMGTTSADPAVTSPVDLSGLAPGMYDYTYTQNILPNPCPEESTTVQVIILEDPDAGNAINATFCENDLSDNSPFDLFDALDGSQDHNNGVWTDATGAVVVNPIDISAFVFEDSPYQYTYTIDNGTCLDSEIISIIVLESPYAGNALPPFQVCEEDAALNSPFDLVTLLDGTQDTNGTWADDDATGALSGSLVDLTMLIPGTYNFTYTVPMIGTCAEDTTTVQIIILPQPETGTAVPFVICETDVAANSPIDLFDLLTGEDLGGTFSDDDGTGALTGSMVDLTILPVGTYTFTYSITAANGCSNDTVITITIEEAPEAGTPTPFEICEEDVAANPTLDLFTQLAGNDTGGTWSDDDASGALSGSIVDLTMLTPGTTYNFTYSVPAVGTCLEDTATVAVTVLPQPVTGTATPLVLCETDLATSPPIDLFDLLTGEDPGGTFSDDNGTGALTGSIVDLTLLTVGTFTFTYSITSADGCSNATIITIIIEEAPEAGTPSPFEICEEDIAANPTLDLFTQLAGNDTGGTWSDDDASGALAGSIVDLTMLTPGTTYNFTYSVPAVGTCLEDTATVAVTVLPQPETGTATPLVLCETDLATSPPIDLFDLLTGEDPGGTFSDDNGTGALTGSIVDLTLLTVGTFTFTYSITSADGCSNATIITITIEEAPEAGTSAPVAICLIDIPLTPTLDLFTALTGNDTGGTWNDDDATGALSGSIVDLTLLTVGVYNFTYTVPGVGSCMDDSVTVQVTINDTPAPNAPSPQAFCDAATVADLIPSGTGIQWYETATDTNPLVDTTPLVDGENYFVTETNPITGCESSERTEVLVEINDSPQSGTPLMPGIEVCSTDTTVDLFDGLAPGSFDPNGTWEDTAATGALTINIFDASVVGAGTYQFTYVVSGTPPCLDASTVITVTVLDPVFAGNDTTLDICSDNGPIDLFTLLTGADSGGTFSPALTSGTGVFDPLQDTDGTYTYTVMNGCNTDTSTIQITVTLAPDAGQDATVTICRIDGVIDLLTVLGGSPDTNGSFSPALASNTTIFDPLLDDEGVYTYTVNAQSPCTNNASASVTVTVNDSEEPNIVEKIARFCASEMPTIADLDNFVVGIDILWYISIDADTPLPITTPLVDGTTYYATQTENAGCESSVRTEIQVIITSVEMPIIDPLAADLCVTDNPTLETLSIQIEQYDENLMNVVWYDEAENGNILPASTLLTNGTTYYAVIVDDLSMCESDERLPVTVDLTVCDRINLPDGFSPNGDSVNDFYIIENLDVVYPNFDLEIYNRNGNLVYKGNAASTPFDGTSNQNRLVSNGKLPVGVYFYILNYNDDIGTQPVQGRLYLSR